MRKVILPVIFIIMVIAGCDYGQKPVSFTKKERYLPPPPPAVEAAIPATETYIHYSPKHCLVCHEKIPERGKNKYLKFSGDHKLLCNCHFAVSEIYLHPVDLEPSQEFKAVMPEGFPLFEGKITCSTCHDIFIQCQESQKIFQKENKFLRKKPAERVTEFCFKCHDKSKYKMYNPHLQLDQNGVVIETKCLYCHTKIPDVDRTSSIDAELVGDIKALCMRCHSKLNEQSLHDRHLQRRPSKKVMATIKNIQERYSTILPLSDDGELVCATCHNPHEKGTIPLQRAGAKGAGEHYRHRLPGNICIKCHQM